MLGIFQILFLFEIQEFGLLLENEYAVEHVAQETDRDRGDGTGQVVVDVQPLQQPDAEAVADPTHYIHHDELEQQAFLLVAEHQLAVSREVKQDADDVADERGEDVGVGNVEEVDEPEERGIDAPPERGVQDGDQHKTDELRVKKALQKVSNHYSTLRRQK